MFFLNTLRESLFRGSRYQCIVHSAIFGPFWIPGDPKIRRHRPVRTGVRAFRLTKPAGGSPGRACPSLPPGGQPGLQIGSQRCTLEYRVCSFFQTFPIFTDLEKHRNSSANHFPNKTILVRFRRAAPFPTGSQNHTFEDKLAPRPSQNLKNHGFPPDPKNTLKIDTESDAFSWPRTTFSIGKQTVS